MTSGPYLSLGGRGHSFGMCRPINLSPVTPPGMDRASLPRKLSGEIKRGLPNYDRCRLLLKDPPCPSPRDDLWPPSEGGDLVSIVEQYDCPCVYPRRMQMVEMTCDKRHRSGSAQDGATLSCVRKNISHRTWPLSLSRRGGPVFYRYATRLTVRLSPESFRGRTRGVFQPLAKGAMSRNRKTLPVPLHGMTSGPLQREGTCLLSSSKTITRASLPS